MRKCKRGEGIRGPMRPTKSLFIYEGYLNKTLTKLFEHEENHLNKENNKLP